MAKFVYPGLDWTPEQIDKWAAELKICPGPLEILPVEDEADTLAIEAVLAAACEIIKDKDARWAKWNDLARSGTLVRSDLLLDLRNAVVELKKRGGVL